MRYPDGHKESVRGRIVDAAAKTLRRKGLGGVSIPVLMKQVGLTHGGFYGHFRSKDELVGEAVRRTAEEPSAFGDASRALPAVLEAYLSDGHLARPAEGCVLAALGTEAPKQPAAVRRAFAEVAIGFLRKIEKKRNPRSPAGALSDETLLLGAQMVGALVLGRLVLDDALARRILQAARQRR